MFNFEFNHKTLKRDIKNPTVIEEKSTNVRVGLGIGFLIISLNILNYIS